MKTRPTFFEGVAVALLASLVGSLAYTALVQFLPVAAVLRLTVAAGALAYALYLLSRSPERLGRLTAIAFWVAGATALWVWAPTLGLYVVAHLGMIWLLRSLYFYSSALASLTDLCLSAVALAAAVWAAGQSGTLFLSLWCFFLVQALFAVIPPRLGHGAGANAAENGDDVFQHAHRAAEAAVRRLSSTR